MESSPQAIYRAEKDKALRERRISHLQLMQEAQEAFRKMLADAQLARKGGRPKSANTQAAQAAAAKRKAAAAAAAASTQTVADVAPVTVTAIPQPTVTKAAKVVAKKEPVRAAAPAKRKPEPAKRVAAAHKAAAPSKSAPAKKAPAKQAAVRKPAAAQRVTKAAPVRKKTTASKSAPARSRATGGSARKGGR